MENAAPLHSYHHHYHIIIGIAIVNIIVINSPFISENWQLCHKNRIQHKGKKKSSLIAIFDADRNTNGKARTKNESLYYEIKDLDLIATDSKYHHVVCN